MLVRRLQRVAPAATLGVGLALGVATLTACGGDETTAGGGPSPSAAPITRATDSPFTATLSGPSLAKAGDTISVTVRNTGRLPNQFQLELDPANAAVATPLSVALSPGQSAKIQLQVQVVPFNINLESASGGLGDYLDTLEVGANG